VATERLKITEIFASIQGEADAVGWPSVFVRLTGCPLRCQYCDTAYAFTGGSWFTLDQIIETVKGFGIARVCVTGGEPLAQPNAKLLLTRLADAGFSVSLETSGALSIEAVDPRVSVVLDIKTPGSAELGRNLLANLGWLKASDQIKFVLCDRGDYEYAKTRVLAEQLHHKAMVLFSPVTPGLAPAQLAEWIIADALPVRFQLQLHKVLWDDARGR
jgi:7-carboxy-7-deazaguanine synthase